MFLRGRALNSRPRFSLKFHLNCPEWIHIAFYWWILLTVSSKIFLQNQLHVFGKINGLTNKTLVTNHEKHAWTLKDLNKIMSSVSYSEHITKNKNSGHMVFIVFFILPGELVFLWKFLFSSVQLLSHVRLFMTPWTAARQAFLSITNSWSPPKPMSTELVMPFNHLILCCPLLLLLSIFPSIRVFSSESVLRIRWPKYWSFSFSISPSNEYSGLISFRMDWLNLLAVQGTLNSLLQHHSSKPSILTCLAFFIV